MLTASHSPLLIYNTHSAAAPGLDLSLLTQYLVPYEVAKGEEDVPWMFDELLEELTQDLHAEMEKKGKWNKKRRGWLSW